MNRREFIRLASLMGGVSLFAGCSLFGDPEAVPRYIEGAPASDPAEILKGVQSVYSTCGLCPGNCGICCRVAEGTLVKIGGNPYNPISAYPALPFETPLVEAVRHAGSVCAIGGSGIQTLYDPFRVVKPLKRVGERGSGKWEAISWEQAIREIVEGGDVFREGTVPGLREIAGSREGLTLFVGRTDWGAMTFVQRFMRAFPAAQVTRDRAVSLEESAREVADAVFGQGTGQVAPDYGHARTVISFGDAPLDSGVPLVGIAREITDARVGSSGFNWAVIDPRLSTSGSKADLWVPVLPGRDLALALGIMRSLFDRHAERLRVTDPALKTAVMGRPGKDYARESGVSTQLMNRLADMLVQGGERSAAIPGRGVLADKNGKDAAAAILTLNLMVGSVPGSGGLTYRHDGFLEQALKFVATGTHFPAKAPDAATSAKALILWEADPVYDDRDRSEALLRNRKELPLFVAIHRHITESTALADYILPDTTYLERWDICSLPPAVTSPGIGMRRPVVGGFDQAKSQYLPIFEQTRPMEEILMALALSLKLPGFGEKSLSNDRDLFTAWDYYGALIPGVLESMKHAGLPMSGSGVTTQHVLDRGGFFLPSQPTRAINPQKSTAMRPWRPSGGILPMGVSSSSLAEDEFMLMTYTLPFHRAPAAGTNRWLLEVLPENRLLINIADARKMGLKQGDALLLDTGASNGHVRCKAQLVPGIMPGVVALAVGFGYRQGGVTPQTIDGVTPTPDKTPGGGVNAGLLVSETRTVKLKRA